MHRLPTYVFLHTERLRKTTTLLIHFGLNVLLFGILHDLLVPKGDGNTSRHSKTLNVSLGLMSRTGLHRDACVKNGSQSKFALTEIIIEQIFK